MNRQTLNYEGELADVSYERPLNGGRFFLEILFYFTILATNFQNLTPLGSIQYGLGGLVVMCGMLFFYAILLSRRAVPFSVLIAILINIPINLTQYTLGDTPIIGSTGASYLQYVCLLMMFCYLIENEGAAKRVTLFLGLVILVAMLKGGSDIVAQQRIELQEGFGGSFRNADDLAHMAAIFSIACLFWSLKAKPYFRPVYWLVATLLLGVLLRTVARGGALAFACGFAMLLLLIVSGKGQRLTGFLLIIFGVIAALLFSGFILRYYYLYSDRLLEDTGRGLVYSFSTLHELMDYWIIGSGNGTRLRSAGIQPHNTFIAMFFFYGGITALLYYIWILVLSIRLFRAFFSRELSSHIRFFLVTLFGMSLLAQLLSNQAQLFLSCMFATALFEKYLPKYSRSQIRKRQLAANEFAAMEETLTDNPPGPDEKLEYVS